MVTSPRNSLLKVSLAPSFLRTVPVMVSPFLRTTWSAASRQPANRKNSRVRVCTLDPYARLPKMTLRGQEFKSVVPLVVLEPTEAPENAQRFDGAGGDDAAAIVGLPAELEDDVGHRALGLGVVAADKHGRRALLIAGIDHVRRPDAVECLDHVRVFQDGLNPLRLRFVGP